MRVLASFTRPGWLDPSRIGSLFAPHILDTNEAKEKDSDAPQGDVSVFPAFGGLGERSKVPASRRSGTTRSMPLWAISASPRRALRRFASTFARNSPARCQ
jgi:hypothetical protein